MKLMKIILKLRMSLITVNLYQHSTHGRQIGKLKTLTATSPFMILMHNIILKVSKIGLTPN